MNLEYVGQKRSILQSQVGQSDGDPYLNRSPGGTRREQDTGRGGAGVGYWPVARVVTRSQKGRRGEGGRGWGHSWKKESNKVKKDLTFFDRFWQFWVKLLVTRSQNLAQIPKITIVPSANTRGTFHSLLGRRQNLFNFTIHVHTCSGANLLLFLRKKILGQIWPFKARNRDYFCL